MFNQDESYREDTEGITTSMETPAKWKRNVFIKKINIFLTTITFGVRAGYGPETGLDCLGCERRLTLGVE